MWMELNLIIPDKNILRVGNRSLDVGTSASHWILFGSGISRDYCLLGLSCRALNSRMIGWHFRSLKIGHERWWAQGRILFMGHFGFGPRGRWASCLIPYNSPFLIRSRCSGKNQGPTSHYYLFLGDVNHQSLMKDKTTFNFRNECDDSLSHQTVIMI